MSFTSVGSTRWLVSTNCHECFIDIEHSEAGIDCRWISVGLLSTHMGWWNGRLRARIADAWRVLRRGAPVSFDLDTAETADDLIAALIHARTAAFGERA